MLETCVVYIHTTGLEAWFSSSRHVDVYFFLCFRSRNGVGGGGLGVSAVRSIWNQQLCIVETTVDGDICFYFKFIFTTSCELERGGENSNNDNRIEFKF